MRFVLGKGCVLAAISLAFILTACGGSSQARSDAHAVGKVKATALPRWYTARFARFFPPAEAPPSLPAHGKLLFELPGGSLYADGHIITDRGVQRLTPYGARLLWSRIRAIGLAVGLFRDNVQAAVENHLEGSYSVCSGRRLIDAELVRQRRTAHVRHPIEAARGLALTRIDTLFANATSRLPAKDWADPTIHPYVPNHYDLSHDLDGPDPAKVPSPARELLAKYEASGFEQGIPTHQTRALIAAFIKSGVKPVRDPGWGPEELSFSLPMARAAGFGIKSTALRVSQDGPPLGGRNCKYPVP